jgi:hypothetical protein
MKAYLITTGSIFGLIVVAHILRIIEEGPHLAKDPGYLLLTVAAGSVSIWAWRLLFKRSKP